MIDQGAKLPNKCCILQLALEFTSHCLENNLIQFEKKSSAEKKVNTLYQIIDIAMERYDESIKSNMWLHGVMFVKKAMKKLEKKIHPYLLKLFDKFIGLKIKFDNSQTCSNNR